MKQDPARGFTLIELVVVIAIIGIIAVAVVPTAFKATERAKVSATLLDYQAVKTGAMNYFNDTSAWPANDAGTTGFVNTDSVNGWEGPYLERWPAKAKWGAGTNTFKNNSTGQDWDGLPVAGPTPDLARYLEITLVPQASAVTIDTKLDPAVGNAAGVVRYTAADPTTVRILIQTAVVVN